MPQTTHEALDALITSIAQTIADRCIAEIDRRKDDERRTQYNKPAKQDHSMPESFGGDRLLKLKQVQQRVALSRSSIYLMMNEGQFPKPVKIGKRAVAWSEDSIACWLKQRKP